MSKTYTIVEMIKRNAAAAKDGMLNQWETMFCLSIADLLARIEAGSALGFSGKQLECIDRIHEKVSNLEAGDD